MPPIAASRDAARARVPREGSRASSSGGAGLWQPPTLCVAARVPQMLSWPAGPKQYDGVWAPWWYGQTHRSTGFQPPAQQEGAAQQTQGQEVPRQQRGSLPPHLAPLLEECRPLYALLRRHALKPLPSAVPRPPGAVDDAGGAALQRQKQRSGTHVYVDDPRNADILIGMRDGMTGGRSGWCCRTSGGPGSAQRVCIRTCPDTFECHASTC